MSTTTDRTIDDAVASLIAALERGGGTVSSEYWVPFMRTLPDDRALVRVEKAAVKWRREHGHEPADEFVVGEPMD